MRHFVWLLAIVMFNSAHSPAQAIKLHLDLSDAPRNIFHERLILPVKPGANTFVYPKWIPGNHRPSGPIANLVGIKFQANGTDLAWRREPVDMYAFHVDAPARSKSKYRWTPPLSATALDRLALQPRPMCSI